MGLQRKTYKALNLAIDKKKREVVAVASTDTVDRVGEVILPSGLRKGIDYGGRPILWSHEDEQLPVGVIKWAKADGDKLIVKYRLSDKTQFARDVFELMQDDCLRFQSIGFDIFEASPPSAEEQKTYPECKRIIRDWELLELSIVNVPCNPEAMVIAKRYCEDTRKMLGAAWEEVAEECWEWDTKELSPQQVKEPVQSVVEAPKALVIPKPRIIRNLSAEKRRRQAELERKAVQLVKARLDPEEIRKRIMGIVG
jgi:HK97 family phage prohead protease